MATSLTIASCNTKRKAQQAQTNTTTQVPPSEEVQQVPLTGAKRMLRPIVIYATRNDYNNLVPVNLSADRETIESFPARSDIKQGDQLATPIVLSDGLLYDQRGIGVNTAFLSLTYEAYSQLEHEPTIEMLKGLLLDKDPLTFLAVCNRDYLQEESVTALNDYIKKGLPGAQILIDKRK